MVFQYAITYYLTVIRTFVLLLGKKLLNISNKTVHSLSQRSLKHIYPIRNTFDEISLSYVQISNLFQREEIVYNEVSYFRDIDIHKHKY